MAHLQESIQVGRPQPAVFLYVADFGNVAEWDPGVTGSERTSAGEVGLGAAFLIEADVRGRKIPLRYEITVWEPPDRVVLVGEGKALRAVDDIRCTPSGRGTRIDYDAEITLTGWWGYAELLLRPAFRRMGRRAMAGLKARLDDSGLPLS